MSASLSRVPGVVFASLAVTVVVTATWSSPVGAQARDATVAATAPAVASITGTVVNEESRRPVRRATVTVSGQNLRTPRLMATDDGGRFQITGLVPGSYNVTVNKAGYVTTYYGSRKPGRSPGQPIVLTETDRTADLSIPLLRGGVITGTILDPFGRPMPDMRVTLAEVRTISGERRITNVLGASGSSSQTDEHGVYRLWGLAPGTFVVSTAPNATLPPNTTIRQMTSQDLEWAQQATSTAAGRGVSTPAPDAGRPVGYATVYYPGVVDVANAGTVTITGSEERNGITFALQLVPTSRIDATVLGVDGQPLTSNVQVMLTLPSGSPGLGTTTRSLGFDRTTSAYSVQGVAPGNYVLTARGSSKANPPPAPPASPIGIGPGLPPPPPPPPVPTVYDLWASIDMPVSGQDVSGIVLALRPGMTVSGKVVFEGKTPPPEFTRVNVGLGITTNDGLAATGVPKPAAADGSFSVTGVTPGRYRPTATVMNAASAQGGGGGGGRGGGGAGVAVAAPAPIPAPVAVNGVAPPSGWRVKSAIWNGRDLMDLPLQVRPNEDVAGVVVTLTDQVTELSGKLQNASGSPAVGYSVIVFPTDRTLWVQNARRIRMVQPGPDGVYRTTGLPAGTYYLGAVTDADSNDLGDQDFLDQLAAASLKITLTDGGKVVQDVRFREKDFGSPFYDFRK